MGRFAVIYDQYQDMAWPLSERSHWGALATEMNNRRGRIFGPKLLSDGTLNPHFIECVPPAPEDVCIKHMMCEFPYDMLGEIREIYEGDIRQCWRECGEYECRHVDQNKQTYEITNAALSAHLDELFPAGSNTYCSVSQSTNSSAYTELKPA